MKKLLSKIFYPFKIAGRWIKKFWLWARGKFLRWPASEAEAFLMSIGLLLSCVWFITYGKLIETQYIVEEKVRVITEQAKTIETYKIKERTLRLPGKTKVVTVTDKQLQQAIRQAQREANEMREAKQRYQDLARKYSKPTPRAANPAARVSSEEKVNDQFIQDWKKAQ